MEFTEINLHQEMYRKIFTEKSWRKECTERDVHKYIYRNKDLQEKIWNQLRQQLTLVTGIVQKYNIIKIKYQIFSITLSVKNVLL